MEHSKILIEAIEIGSLEVVKLLLDNGHRNNESLYWASRNGNLEIV